MKRTVILFSILALTAPQTLAQSSEDAAVRACEASIIGGLRSPASYALFKVEHFPGGVEIIYDASNAFGALLRDKARCTFIATDEGLRLSSEPAVAVANGNDSCMGEVRGWIASGNITERAAKPFIEECDAKNTLDQHRFIQSFRDLDVVYPVPKDQTSIVAIQ